MSSPQSLQRSALACMTCLGVHSHDRVLVVSNEPNRRLAEALVEAARGRTAAVHHLEYPTLERDGEEPPPAVARALADAMTCRVTSPAGTNVVLSLRGRTAHEDNGQLQSPGAFGNLPAGEAYVAPIETEGDGTIVVDGSLAGYGLLRQPLRIDLHRGRIVNAEGEGADWLLTTLDAGGGNGRTIAELGIGVNPGAKLTGAVILDEKARGTAHVAFGTNMSFGGANAAGVHIDAVLRKPTVCLDGEPLIHEGEPQFGDEN